MNAKKRYLPTPVKYKIVFGSEEGYSYSEIREIIKQRFNHEVSRGTICKLIQKFEECGSVKDRPRSGRPYKLTERDQRRVVRAVKAQRSLSSKDISNNEFLNKNGVCSKTIRNILVKNGLKCGFGIPRMISLKNIKERYHFAKKYDIENPMDFWERVIFSDESDLFPKKSGKFMFRRYTGEKPELDTGSAYLHDPRTIKVWGFIGSDGVGKLVRYSGTMDSKKYLEVLDQNLLQTYPSLRDTIKKPHWLIFQDDNAKPHRAKIVQDWITKNGIKKLEWPPQSPDLNIIENVWAIIKDGLWKKNKSLTTTDDVWREASRIWTDEIDNIIFKLYKSLPDRIKELKRVKGSRIPH